MIISERDKSFTTVADIAAAKCNQNVMTDIRWYKVGQRYIFIREKNKLASGQLGINSGQLSVFLASASRSRFRVYEDKSRRIGNQDN